METSRYFFALWPNPVVARQLAALQAPLAGGRLTHQSDFHLTLAFLGQPRPDQHAALRRIAQNVPRPAFELRLDRVDTFERLKLAWVGPSEVPTGLLALRDHLGHLLDQEGIWYDKQFSFRPHVTLARKVTVVPRRLDAPVIWWADRFVLAHSHPQPNGAKYSLA